MSTLPSLTAYLVTRKRSPMPAPPAALPTGLEIDYELALPAMAAVPEEAPSRWRDDVRFFATCYVVGLVFFLVMLS